MELGKVNNKLKQEHTKRQINFHLLWIFGHLNTRYQTYANTSNLCQYLKRRQLYVLGYVYSIPYRYKVGQPNYINIVKNDLKRPYSVAYF